MLARLSIFLNILCAVYIYYLSEPTPTCKQLYQNVHHFIFSKGAHLEHKTPEQAQQDQKEESPSAVVNVLEKLNSTLQNIEANSANNGAAGPGTPSAQ